jgi:hypothetical protein
VVATTLSLLSGVASSSAFRDQCAVASVDSPRTQFDKVQIQTIELVFGEDNAGRDQLVAIAMVQQFEKNVPELLTAAGTEVQIIETDGFKLYLSR